LKPKKPIGKYVAAYPSSTEFFSSYGADIIEEQMINYLVKCKVQPIVSKDKYKLKFTFPIQSNLGLEDPENT